MNISIRARENFWKEKQYFVAEKGRGWRIERPCGSAQEKNSELDNMLNKFFKKKRKWE